MAPFTKDTMTSHEHGVFFNAKGKKTFIPLEINPEIFEEIVHKLGVSPDLGFFDVYSIDDPDLLAMIPRPVHAIIFIAAANVYHQVRKHDGSKELTYDASGEGEPVMWFKQTIGHACGLMALLHCISNGSTKQYILPDSDLDKLLKKALPLNPWPRAEVLYNSPEIEKAHMAAAWKGDSTAPMAEEPNGYHFLSFVRSEKDGHLYEMDASWNGPIDRGELADGEDMLSEQALKQGIRRFMSLADDVVEFGIVALAKKDP
ncbi:hypothetical protein AMS68_000582 [Peltaster fructicola]|uniref:Ubiquitin carboxyl-terminal hydrolase n=1 Tax=Peltaster fructicola TaxID=286661 RepID=A0A6H0XKB5_9PEZI|nr:hypothetical protein AMS68_000582 [Peltaster fructicola]